MSIQANSARVEYHFYRLSCALLDSVLVPFKYMLLVTVFTTLISFWLEPGGPTPFGLGLYSAAPHLPAMITK